ncbi:unnamed protein product [Ixodes persulcatus]
MYAFSATNSSVQQHTCYGSVPGTEKRCRASDLLTLSDTRKAFSVHCHTRERTIVANPDNV